ncbi:hypothetical protein MtrunA17_Chr8g0365371 [Medicago truncatula]|uniref:Uncharacterized protein n=1 Tax=Medicago truncatula TaxID=3880 RepID=A0A396GK44_MEDTR|nr:hypothetical protein MtrunA17_Chr8g0365371 [Medicago truncatula]
MNEAVGTVSNLKKKQLGEKAVLSTDQRQHKLKVQLGSNGIKKRAEDFRLKEFGGGKRMLINRHHNSLLRGLTSHITETLHATKRRALVWG